MKQRDRMSRDRLSDKECLEVIDTTHLLTVDELTEFKRIIQLSKISRVIMGILFGIMAMIGLPTIFEYIVKAVK